MKKYLFLFLAFLFLPLTAKAELHLDLNRGMTEPLPVAVTNFYAAGAGQDLATQIPQVVSADLAGSGLIRPVNPAAFVQDTNSIQQSGPHFDEWRATGTQGLITGTVTDAGGGKARVEFRLWDVYGQ